MNLLILVLCVDNLVAIAEESFQVGKTYWNFECYESNRVQENVEMYHFRHKKTATELIALKTVDRTETFNIAIQTPPENSNGAAHVLEHSLVLVLLLPVNLHVLAEHLLRQRLLGFIAEGLAAFRCVDGEQPNLELLVACSEYRDGVAVRDAHHFASERRRLGGEGG